MDEFTRRLSQGFDQVKQFASEKMGLAEDITEFPPAYRQLDGKVDQLHDIFEGLYRTVLQLRDADRYDPPMKDTLKDSFTKLEARIKNKEFVDENGDALFFASDDQGKSIQQVTSEICLAGAALLGDEPNISSDKSSAELMKAYGVIQTRLAEARAKMNQRLEDEFLVPFSTFEAAYEKANKYRKNATRVRLLLDACKSRQKSASVEKLDECNQELANLEHEFTLASDDTIHEMRNFIQHAKTIKCLEAMVAIQLEYHTRCAEILAQFGC